MSKSVEMLKANEDLLRCAGRLANNGINDFELTKYRGGFRVVFDAKSPLYCDWLDTVYIEYVPAEKFWRYELRGIEVLNTCCPLQEIACEYRGYMPFGAMIRDDAFCIDAGTGSSGIFGLLCAKMASRGQTFFVEADPRPLRNCAHNIALNGLGNTFLFNNALSNNLGPISFSLAQDVGASKIGDGAENTISVYGITLDHLLTIANARKDQTILVKMDIEGAEVDLVEDIARIVVEYPKAVFSVASYHRIDREFTRKLMHTALEGRSDVYARSIFWPHSSTVVCNAGNATVCRKLQNVAEVAD